jgi:hypothetical protein
MIPVIPTSTIAATHVLHVRHALTGGVVPGLGATLLPPTPWWYSLKLTPAGDVAVVAADRFPDDADDPVVLLSVADPAIAASLTQPLVEVTLDQAEDTHTFTSANLTLTVLLVDKAGKPKTGLTNVRAVPASGTAIVLPEVAAEPGTYRSAPHAWTTAQLRFDIKSGSTSVGSFRLNPFALDTRLHGVVA